MRAIACTTVAVLVALALAGCSDSAPTPATGPASPTAVAPTATLDADTLRERAAVALAANRLFAPAGDNAVENYLALRERQPGDATVETALVDLAPYVVIGAEQATADRMFDEAQRLIGLLERMDAGAPASPRLREALAVARASAEAEAAAEALALAEADAAREAAQAARAAASAQATAAATRQANPTTAPASPPPARRPAPPPVAQLPPASAPAVTPPPTAPARSAPAARALISRVPARFPESALRRRLEGEVEVGVVIRADGSVQSVEVVRATPPGVFDREAVLAVRRWRYAPADAPSGARVVLQFRRPDGDGG